MNLYRSLVFRTKASLSRTMKSRGKLTKAVDNLLVDLHRSYENVDYDLGTNGERRLLETLSKEALLHDPPTLIDVGANRGEWTLAAAHLFPKAVLHSFEIVPDTFHTLRDATKGIASVHCHNVGLSHTAGELEMHVPEHNLTVATAVGGFTERFHGLRTNCIKASVITGDEFCASADVRQIDFLKIDVEGYEDKVLAGFQRTLGEGRIKTIQFEYGKVNIETHFLLRDFYYLLQPLGYRIGKIYPNYVDFREYRHEHEDFLGPNYLAVHETCPRTIEHLCRRV